MIEFYGTFSIAFCVSLSNISSYKENGGSSIIPALVYGILILMFSQFSRGYSKGFFNPYYSIFEILSGRLSIERGIGTLSFMPRFLEFLHLGPCTSRTSACSTPVVTQSVHFRPILGGVHGHLDDHIPVPVRGFPGHQILVRRQHLRQPRIRLLLGFFLHRAGLAVHLSVLHVLR